MSNDELQELGRGRFLRLVKANGWEYADRTTGAAVVAIVAVTAHGELVLTEQFRPPVGKQVVDLPAGLVGDVVGEEDESLEAAARREFLEETGFEADVWTEALTAPTSPGLSTELVTIFLAQGARRVATGGGDASEEIRVLLAPLADWSEWRRRVEADGALLDLKVFAALSLLAAAQGQARV